MSVIITFQMPGSYEQYLELNKKVNPENILPPGCLSHVVSQNETGLTMTDIWEDESTVTAFLQGVSAASGMPVPPVTIAKVYDYVV